MTFSTYQVAGAWAQFFSFKSRPPPMTNDLHVFWFKMLHGVVAIETHFSVKDHVPGDKHDLLLVYDVSEQVPPVTFVLKESKY